MLTAWNSTLHRIRAGVRLQFSYEAIDQDEPRQGTSDVAFQRVRRPDHDEIATENRNWNFRAAYTVSPRWDVGITVPIVRRRHSHVGAAGHHGEEDSQGNGAHGTIERWDFTQLGDMVARVDARAYQRGATKLRLGFGLRLPTGSTSVCNSAG
jgi:hypothetical protein